MIVETFVTGPLETNTFLLYDRRGGEAIVIDPGGETGAIVARIKEQGLSLAAIVLTHGHFDHIGGNRELKKATGAPILVHRADEPMFSQAKATADMFFVVSDNSPPADGYLEDGGEVKFGDALLAVAHTPGHSPGGVTLIGEGRAFCGDLVFYGSVGRTDLPGGSQPELLKSIRERIMVLPEETILLPGHGPETTVGREKTQNPYFN